ncbi:hypothetical protein GGR50DRAFT_658548 [Xylaria sp. CBS 124048]|nr:hypothetical protein GGR50DRAFT_658548 [Xylaria sp. CBS 124048]
MTCLCLILCLSCLIPRRPLSRGPRDSQATGFTLNKTSGLGFVVWWFGVFWNSKKLVESGRRRPLGCAIYLPINGIKTPKRIIMSSWDNHMKL